MKIFLFTITAILLFACGSKVEREQHQSDPAVNTNFDEFRQSFVDSLCHYEPILAAKAGLDHCDSVLVIPTNQLIAAQLLFQQEALKNLNNFKYDLLSYENQRDYYWIKNIAENAVLSLSGMREWEWNPAIYYLQQEFEFILRNEGKKLLYKLNGIKKKLEKVPEYYMQAKMNIVQPSEAHVKIAIRDLKNSLDFFNNELPDSLQKVEDQQLDKTSFLSDLAEASLALEDFIGWLEKDVLPNLNSSLSTAYSIGKENYSMRFDSETNSIYSADEMFGKAMEVKAKTKNKMALLADSLWQGYFGILKKPNDQRKITDLVTDTIAASYASSSSANDQAVSFADFVDFVHENELLPDDFFIEDEHNGSNKSISVVELLNLIAAQTVQFHESSESEAAAVSHEERSQYVGWALYLLQTSIEQGFAENQPEFRMLFYRELLKAACRSILGYDVHVRGMNEREVIEMLTFEAHLPLEEAQSIWGQVLLKPVENSVAFTSYYEILQLRNEIKSRAGRDFELEDFHEYFLSFGSLPINHIRIEMMKNGNGKNASA